MELYKVTFLTLLYLSCTELEGLSMSGKELEEIMRTEIRHPKTVSIITRLCRQCYKSVEVSKVNNIERRIAGVAQEPLRILRGVHL